MGLRMARLALSERLWGRCRSRVRAATCTGPPDSAARDLPLLVGLDHVALLEVLEVRQADAALEAALDLACVVLEPLEGRDRALPYDYPVAQESHLGAAGDDAVGHVAAGDGAHARHPVDDPHLGVAGDDLLVLGGEHADHGGLDVLEDLVDDLVGA